MKKNWRRGLTLLLAGVILIGGLAVVSVGASDPQVWEDDFASGKGGSYTPYGYWWNLDGQLRAAADDNATGWWTYYYLKDLVWDDVVVEFDVVSQTSTFGVVLRAGNPGPGADQGDGYAVMYDMGWAFFGSLNGSWTQLKTSPEGSGLPTAYQPKSVPTHWKIEAKGDVLTVYFDGSDTPAMAVQSDLWSSGQIGFRALTYAGKDTAVLKNLSIREIDSTPPTTTEEPTTTTEEPTTTTEEPTTTTEEPTTTTEEPTTTTEEPTTTTEEPTTTTEEPTTTTETDPDVPGQTQSWEDDFGSGKGGFYTPYGYWWNLDGQLRAAADDNATGWWTYYYLKDLVWDDVVVEFDVVSQTSTFGVVLRAGNPGPGADQGDGYAIMYDMSWAFFGSLNGSWTQLKTSPEGSGLPTAYQPKSVPTHWKIEAKGDVLTVYFDGSDTPAMAVQSNLWSSGQIGFRALTYAGKDTAVLKNLSIREIGSTTTTTEGSTTTTGEDPTTTTTDPSTTTTADPTTGTTPTEEILSWEDDFNSGKGDSYTPYGLWWNDYVSIDTGKDYSGVLANEGGNTTGWAYYYLKDKTFGDFILEFDVIEQSSGQFGVVLRAGNPGPGADQGDGYAVMYDKDWAFVGTLDGQFHQVKTATEGYPNACQPEGVPTHWKIVAKGNVISVYFNGETTPSFSVTDDTYQRGSIGFRVLANAGETNVILDNLTITEIKTVDSGDSVDTGDAAAGTALALAVGTVALLTVALTCRRREKAR